MGVNDKGKKRQPIRKKVQRVMMAIALTVLALTSAGGVLSMIFIQRDSEAALIQQMEQNLHDLVTSKARLADSELGKYGACVRTFANYLSELYRNSNSIASRYVPPISAENANVYAMQRSLARRDISIGDVREELLLLGNAEHIWKPVMAENNRIITTIYLGTESGLMLSYDAQSQLALPEEGDSDSYYNYLDTSWYRRAKGMNSLAFTEVYRDIYGRGLTITSSAPFYNEEGKFAGVVGMDLLISELYDAVVDLDIGEGAYAFLVDRRGNLIEPSVHTDSENARNLYYIYDRDIGSEIAGQILRGKTGVSLSKGGDYYAYSPIPSTGWKLCLRIPESAILAPVRSVKRNVVVMMCFFITIGVWVIALTVFSSSSLSARLTGPIVALGKDVKKISEGDLDYRAEVHSDDEVGDLAMGFNNMAASLKAYVENLFAITAERERIGAELDIATKIQADLLPCTFPPFPDRSEFAIYATMTPAKEVGGDFYDFFLIDSDHLVLVMADVAGKGVPAALFMVIAKTLIKNRAQMGGDPSDILAAVNDQLCEESSSELFVTVWLGILEISTGKVVATNAGHEYPAIRRAGGSYRLMQLGNNPAVATLEGMKFRDDRFTLHPGDCLFLYTDGVAEATRVVPSANADEEQELYGTARMLEALNRHGTEPVEELLISMKHDIDAFAGDTPQFDDITMLALQYYGKEGKPVEDDLLEKEGELTAEARTERLEPVLAFVDRHLEEYGCSPRVQMQIDLAVEEIFINISHYAYTPGRGSATIRFEILSRAPHSRQEDIAVITLIDSGIPYDPLARPDPDVTLSAEERPIGGLGIYMAKKSMDDIFYERRDGRNILRMQKRLEKF